MDAHRDVELLGQLPVRFQALVVWRDAVVLRTDLTEHPQAPIAVAGAQLVESGFTLSAERQLDTRNEA
jgi:hypothetical protein